MTNKAYDPVGELTARQRRNQHQALIDILRQNPSLEIALMNLVPQLSVQQRMRPAGESIGGLADNALAIAKALLTIDESRLTGGLLGLAATAVRMLMGEIDSKTLLGRVFSRRNK